MNKINRLIQKIDTFCTQALCSFLLIKKAAEPQGFHMPDDDEPVSPGGGNNLLARADQFDIKDEELFNQFESFMDAYRDLVESLSVDAKNLTPEAFEDAGQLIDTLNKRYERIMNNQYLNVSDTEGFDEDFNPGELTSFVQEVVRDAESQLKAIAGEDIDMDEIRAAQYAQEFNDNKNIDRGDPNVTWTGNKVQQNLEARREWFKKLMFVKKIGQSHPEYERYERYIQTRKEAFKRIMSDPQRRADYREKANVRYNKADKKALLRQKEELEALLAKPMSSRQKAEIEEQLARLNARIAKRQGKLTDKFKRVKEKRESASLAGAIERLKSKLATQKSEAVKAIKAKAAKDPVFEPYKKAVADAKSALDASPSPAAQAALEAAIRAEADALKNYLDNHPIVTKVKEDLALLYAFRDKAKTASESGWVGDEGVADEVKPHLYQLLVEGEELVKQFGKIYRAPCGAIKEIVDFIKSKL